MEEYQACAEKLRRDAAYAALVHDLSRSIREARAIARLHHNFRRLAEEVERAMKQASS